MKYMLIGVYLHMSFTERTAAQNYDTFVQWLIDNGSKFPKAELRVCTWQDHVTEIPNVDFSCPEIFEFSILVIGKKCGRLLTILF